MQSEKTGHQAPLTVSNQNLHLHTLANFEHFIDKDSKPYILYKFNHFIFYRTLYGIKLILLH